MATIGGISDQKDAYILGTYSAASSAANTAMEPHTITHRNVNMPINTLFFSLIVKISSLSLLIVNTKMP